VPRFRLTKSRLQGQKPARAGQNRNLPPSLPSTSPTAIRNKDRHGPHHGLRPLPGTGDNCRCSKSRPGKSGDVSPFAYARNPSRTMPASEAALSIVRSSPWFRASEPARSANASICADSFTNFSGGRRGKSSALSANRSSQRSRERSLLPSNLAARSVRRCSSWSNRSPGVGCSSFGKRLGLIFRRLSVSH